MWTYTIGIVAAYLLGAVPFGLLLARLKGVDIRTLGSGNIGATNVFRMVGKPVGVLTFALDFFKGFLPVFVFPLVAAHYGGEADGQGILGLLCGMAAIAGHNWPVYLRFRGGKGVATGAGVLTGLLPRAVGIGLLVWLAVLLLTGYVSLASMLAAAGVAGAAWYYYSTGVASLAEALALSLIAVLIVVRHRSNVVRLVRGEEHRFSFFRRGKLYLLACSMVFLQAQAAAGAPISLKVFDRLAERVELEYIRSGASEIKRLPMQRQAFGVWQADFEAEEGAYEYRFVADGEWISDIGNPSFNQWDDGSVWSLFSACGEEAIRTTGGAGPGIWTFSKHRGLPVIWTRFARRRGPGLTGKVSA